MMLGLAGILLLLFSSLPRYCGFAWQATTLPHVSSRLTSTKSNECNNNDNEKDTDDVRCTLEEALAKMEVISQAKFSARFNKRRINAVEVKESSIPGAGLGLFAKNQIKAGTIISLYPVDTLGIDLGESIRRVSRDTHTGQTYEEEESEVSRDKPYLLHVMGTRLLMKSDIVKDLGGASIFLDVDMNQQETAGFNSHRVNDGATVLTNSESGVLKYYHETRQAKNCVHVPWGPSPLMATVATRKIKKGSELFTSYGCSYWLEVLMRETGEVEEETYMTESIVSEAKEVAMDILREMKSVSVTNAAEANELHIIFDEQ